MLGIRSVSAGSIRLVLPSMSQCGDILIKGQTWQVLFKLYTKTQYAATMYRGLCLLKATETFLKQSTVGYMGYMLLYVLFTCYSVIFSMVTTVFDKRFWHYFYNNYWLDMHWTHSLLFFVHFLRKVCAVDWYVTYWIDFNKHKLLGILAKYQVFVYNLIRNGTLVKYQLYRVPCSHSTLNFHSSPFSS